MEIRSFLTRLLSRRDCLVEETEAAGLRVLFPPELQESLQVGEMEVFDLPRGERRTLSLVHNGRDFIEVLESLALSSGLYSTVAFPGLTFPVADPEGFLASRLTIQNGIWRLREVRPETCGYLVVNFRLTATADTRAERLATVAVNERTGTIPVGMAALLPEYLARKLIREPYDGAADLPRVLAAARQQAGIVAGEIFREFRTNLNRRLARDLTRLQEYYLTLAGEIEKRLRKKGHDPREQERAVSRLEATKADYLKKIQDARDKYALEIVIEPVNALRVELPATMLEVALQRRKETRLASLPVNPLTRSPEAPVCERCRAPVLNFHLCDALHILCPACFPRCPVCNGKSP